MNNTSNKPDTSAKPHDLAISLINGETLVQMAVELPKLEQDETVTYYTVEVIFDATYEPVDKLISLVTGEPTFSFRPGSLTKLDSLHDKFKERINGLIEDTLTKAKEIK